MPTVTDGFTLSDLLGHVYLTRALQEIQTGIPDVLPAEMSGASVTEEVPADEARWVILRGTRRAARRLNYESRSRQRSLQNIGIGEAKLWHSREFIHLDATKYLTLRAYEGYELQPLGQQEIERQLLQFAQIFDNAEIAMQAISLAKGAIYWDADGNLKTSTQAASGGVDCDFQVPANNQNQLNGIIGASWATASTDVIADMLAIKKTARQTTGYPVEVAFYGENIVSYLSKNDVLKAYWQFNEGMNDHLLSTNEIPDGFMGIKKWVPVYQSFFEDETGTVTEFFGGDQIIFTPAIDITWYQRYLGAYPMPTTFQPVNGMPSLQGAGIEVVHGKFSYGVPSGDPVGLDIYHGHTFLPVIRNPSAIFIADVTP